MAELNSLASCATNISNVYLYAKTKEKVYIVTRLEFGDYRLYNSSACWGETFAEILKNMVSKLKANSNLWLKSKGDYYEYIAVYVDDVFV